jgi:hypothetical protein
MKANPDSFDSCFFLTINRLKGWFLPALAQQEGLAPHPRFTEGEFGWGVEKSQINLLLTFIPNGFQNPLGIRGIFEILVIHLAPFSRALRIMIQLLYSV